MRKLYRSQKDKMIAGILGGFGEYFKVDPTLLRAVYVIAAIVTVFIPLTVAYIILMFIIPKQFEGRYTKESDDELPGPPHRPWR